MSDSFSGYPLSTHVIKETQSEEELHAKHIGQARILLHAMKYRNQNLLVPLEVVRQQKTIEGVHYDLSSVFGVDRIRITPLGVPKPKPSIVENPVKKEFRKRTTEQVWEEEGEVGPTTIEILWATGSLYYKMSDNPPNGSPEYYDVNDYDVNFKPLLEGRKLLAESIPDIVSVNGQNYTVVFSILLIFAPLVGSVSNQGQFNLYDYKGVASYAPNLTREQFITLEHEELPWEEIDLKTFDNGEDGAWYYNVNPLNSDGYTTESFSTYIYYPTLISTLIQRYLGTEPLSTHPVPGLDYGETNKLIVPTILKMLVCDMVYARFTDDESEVEYFDRMFGNSLKELIIRESVMCYLYNSNLITNYDTLHSEMPEGSSRENEDKPDERRIGGLDYFLSDEEGEPYYLVKGYNMEARPAEEDSNHAKQDYLDYATRERLGVIERIGHDIGTDIDYAVTRRTDPDSIDIDSELIATYTVGDEVFYREADFFNTEPDSVTRKIEI